MVPATIEALKQAETVWEASLTHHDRQQWGIQNEAQRPKELWLGSGRPASQVSTRQGVTLATPC